jgi:hypothetical protein
MMILQSGTHRSIPLCRFGIAVAYCREPDTPKNNLVRIFQRILVRLGEGDKPQGKALIRHREIAAFRRENLLSKAFPLFL